MTRFAHSFWKFTSYGFFSAVGIWVIYDEPYIRDTRRFWSQYGAPMADDHRLIYLLELAYYIYDLPRLLFYDRKRKDWGVMIAHHFCTIALVGGSLAMGFHKVGVPIMVLHDVCDVFLESAKFCKYTCKVTN